MSVITRINGLEESVQEIVAGSGDLSSFPVFAEDYARQILLSIEGMTTSEFNELDLERLVRDAFQDSTIILSQDLEDDILNRIDTTLEKTVSFYADFIDDMTDTTLRSAIEGHHAYQALTKHLKNDFAAMNKKLFDGTISAITEQFQAGELNRAKLQEAILAKTDTFAAHAKTNAHMAVSSHNRLGRKAVKDSAGLQHGYYYGQRRGNTRAFCSHMIGRVLHTDQIQQLSNGQGLDVEVHCGGYRCIHSWMWVELSWDQEIADLYEKELEIIDLRADSLNLSVPA